MNPSLHWRILDETWQDLLVDSLRHSELVPLMVTSLPSSGNFSDSMDTVGIGLHLKQIQCTKLFTESSWWQWCHGIVTSIWPTAGCKKKAVTIHWGISMHTKNYVLQSGYKSPNTTYVLRLFAIWMLKLYHWTHSCTHESPFSFNSLGLQWVPIRSLKVVYSDMQSDSEDPLRQIFHSSSTFINN